VRGDTAGVTALWSNWVGTIVPAGPHACGVDGGGH
jgi:hypothetical protein